MPRQERRGLLRKRREPARRPDDRSDVDAQVLVDRARRGVTRRRVREDGDRVPPAQCTDHVVDPQREPLLRREGQIGRDDEDPQVESPTSIGRRRWPPATFREWHDGRVTTGPLSMERRSPTDRGVHVGPETADQVAPDRVLASVIVPTWQRRASVARLLEALTRQTLEPGAFEVIVVVDGSTDGTVELLAAGWRPLQLLVHRQDNSGRAAACNAGLALA